MLDKIKKLRIQAMKDRNQNSRIAYEGVISIIDTARGRGVEITEEYIINSIKREIKAYAEMDYDASAALKSAVLEELLPRQLTTEELEQKAEAYSGIETPKDWLGYLDIEFAGQYDKRAAIQVFNEIIKTSGGRK